MRITNKKAADMTGDGIDPFSSLFFASMLQLSGKCDIESVRHVISLEHILRLNAVHWKPLYPIYYY